MCCDNIPRGRHKGLWSWYSLSPQRKTGASLCTRTPRRTGTYRGAKAYKSRRLLPRARTGWGVHKSPRGKSQASLKRKSYLTEDHLLPPTYVRQACRYGGVARNPAPSISCFARRNLLHRSLQEGKTTEWKCDANLSTTAIVVNAFFFNSCCY
jgi:hypothetical protein